MKVINDINVEDHFEELLISLSISSEVDPAFPAAISKNGNATIQIYDLGEGTILKKTTFAVAGGALDYLWGWGVEGNGLSGPTWLDDKGLYSVDQYFSGSQMMRDEYYEDPRGNTFILGDYNATALSANQCQDKGLNADAYNGTSEAPILDHVSGGHFPKDSYLSPRSIVVENFPSLQITISVWLRTIDTSAPGIIFAFLSNNTLRKGSSREYEFALYDARNLKAMIKTALPTSQQLKNPHLRQANREFTSGAAVNDGEWRFISITWQSETGVCRIYIDGG